MTTVPTNSSPALADYDLITGEDGYGVKVPEHTDETRRRAAESLLSTEKLINDDEATRQLVELGRKAILWRHLGDPEETGCSCEEEGWWCPEGDGERGLFWWFDSSDLVKVVDAAYKRGVE